MHDGEIVAHFIGSDLKAPDPGSVLWKKAHPVHLERYWSGEVAPPPRHASVRMLWSTRALYVRFVCHQQEPLIVSENAQTEKKTMGLWNRDVCEVFLAPNPDSLNRYFEFEAAPNGEWLDVAISWKPEGRESDWNFQSHITTATHIVAGWTIVALRIPWTEQIPEPRKGDRWRVNLFRCVGKDPNRGYVAWHPTNLPEPGFHLPEVFGWLLFE